MTSYSLLLGRSFRLVACLAAPLALGQIIQDHPELCGRPNGYIALPKGLTAVSTELETNLVIPHNDGSATTVTMGAVEKIQQVCPIANGRLVVFGLFHDPEVKEIYLLDGATGAELDSFAVSNPAMSPDQHWLAMRDWQPWFSYSFGSEQYYLYDLTKNREGNRFQGVDYRYVRPLGRTMYPVTPGHHPFEADISREEGHTFEGGSFLWAPDSKSVLFLDRTPAGVSVVLARIIGENLATYVRPLGANACVAPLSRAEFGSSQGSSPPDVRLEFESRCPALRVQGSDFKLAPTEIPKPVIHKPSVEDKKR